MGNRNRIAVASAEHVRIGRAGAMKAALPV